jgi:hypothetical protein
MFPGLFRSARNDATNILTPARRLIVSIAQTTKQFLELFSASIRERPNDLCGLLSNRFQIRIAYRDLLEIVPTVSIVSEIMKLVADVSRDVFCSKIYALGERPMDQFCSNEHRCQWKSDEHAENEPDVISETMKIPLEHFYAFDMKRSTVESRSCVIGANLHTGSAIEYFTWLSAKLDSMEAMPSSRVSLVFKNAS